MRLLFFYCKKLEIKNIIQSTRTAKFEETEGTDVNENNSLMIFVCIEGDSDKEYLDEAIKEIEDIQKQTKTDSIVLVPFAHLTDKIPKPKVAFEVFNILYDKLKEEGFGVMKTHFSSHKELKLHIPAHPYEVVYRKIPKPKWKG